MLLTSNQLMDRNIITKVYEENVQQNGIDLNLIKVERIKFGEIGFIPKEGKTKLPQYEEVLPEQVTTNGADCLHFWNLKPGTYNITLEQGCKIPKNVGFEIFQRSSLLRCGTFIRSSWFDPGFETENIGTIMFVTECIRIECGARVAQVIASESKEEATKYKGQFQNDQQRASEIDFKRMNKKD